MGKNPDGEIGRRCPPSPARRWARSWSAPASRGSRRGTGAASVPAAEKSSLVVPMRCVLLQVGRYVCLSVAPRSVRSGVLKRTV